MLNRFDEWLLDEELRERTSHYASDANTCKRQLWYKWRGLEKSDPITSGAMLKMKMGNAAESIFRDYIQYLLERGEIKSFEEQEAKRVEIKGLKYPISMKADFVVDGEYFIELKTSYGAGIKRIQETQKPKDEHIIQCLFYLHYIKPKGKLIYLGRDNGYRTEFDLEGTAEGVMCNQKCYPTSLDDLIEKFIYIESMIRDDSCPPRDYRVAIKDGEIKDKFQRNKEIYKTDWQCGYCGWKSHCWAQSIELAQRTGGMYYGEESVA